jgi:hypothetical protein
MSITEVALSFQADKTIDLTLQEERRPPVLGLCESWNSVPLWQVTIVLILALLV